ncbi:type II secretion system protein F [Alkalihalobacillus alcalophilus ATCC 27647 = CGMCC 1.3604]|uniref:Type II secretion system protein F n=1 Tax=Alkalihalobacillus alcalophilus ATCC 27647 = CGMCC 1.3604 TaxID=1218173 RepID=A0A094YVS2_ALKAL|nr:type II secretion system F family protein [Alkalihalobacillus alcalophilus]KGA97617.1 type II secretion system protein F [Alkalihalobacillus alcalophilus ATCC 27647 = CGMCC 1.3604]MED1561405.1 type II secretion system F family protein [Alkalihalobacillus alcalophilus]THG91446.1 type II secretion system protein F [Alkalihalobacillus alcalophilus ATCC 27647 = CGMCC 1.3604]
MGLYSYQGKKVNGEKVLGKLQAKTKKEARLQLKEQGVIVLQLEPINELLFKELDLGLKKVKTQDFVLFLRQFSTLLKAGIPIVAATNISAEQTTSKPLKGALAGVTEDVNSGVSLSEATKKHPAIFPELFVNMVYAGEMGGNLDDILERLADDYEKQYRTKQKITAAMTYPLVVSLFALGVVIFLLTVIVPMFASMFANMNQQLPLITIIVMKAGEVISDFWWLLLGMGIIIATMLVMIKNERKYRYYFDLFILKIPVLGKLVQKAVLARITRLLSSLFASSVPIIHAVEIVERIVDNEVVNRVLKESRVYLEKGESITVPMKGHWVFPPLVTQLITVGERTGTLDTMLEKVADYYEAEVDTGTDQLKAFIEPVMIVGLAVIVGTIVMAIIVPMFTLFQHIG